MDFNKFFQSKALKIVLIIIGILVMALAIFKVGEFVGFRKAHFSYRWADNYQRNFGGPRGGFIKEFSGGDLMNAHGVAGQIIKIDGTSLVIKDRDNIEKIVTVNDKTVINSFRQTIKVADLRVDDLIVVIGEPNESGQIAAKLIRILPAPPEGVSTSTPALPPSSGGQVGPSYQPHLWH